MFGSPLPPAASGACFRQLERLADVEIAYEGGGQFIVTTIMGTVRDQAGLFGLLSFIRWLFVTSLALLRKPTNIKS
ncbi:MAG: hypothetical protein DPW18_16515 [Chloroflexi bacterium]|nr:MAG: hypothetical protein EDM79_17605 [Chloroflexota bacterium]MCQ3938631.1 hypothetical protein [Chloroflexota bacterium]MDL1943260.1 hypothetical protein [Chloroflexi bacterium CFX2]